MSGTAVKGNQQLPDEFDDVTAEIKYPPITKDTTEKEFVHKAGNGYMTWVVVAGAGGVLGFVLFMWGVSQMVKWF